MFRMIRRLPFFKLVAVVQLALLARRHLGALTAAERKRMAELARHPRRLTPASAPSCATSRSSSNRARSRARGGRPSVAAAAAEAVQGTRMSLELSAAPAVTASV